MRRTRFAQVAGCPLSRIFRIIPVNSFMYVWWLLWTCDALYIHNFHSSIIVSIAFYRKDLVCLKGLGLAPFSFHIFGIKAIFALLQFCAMYPNLRLLLTRCIRCCLFAGIWESLYWGLEANISQLISNKYWNWSLLTTVNIANKTNNHKTSCTVNTNNSKFPRKSL